MRFELLEGEALCGVFTMRRTAMADAELLAAKRGQRIRWGRPRDGVMTGERDPARGDAPFTVRPVARDS